jgi:acetyl-CoA carboxylase biotin carboxylase subunit
MVRIARGEPLGFVQEDSSARGAAIECRVYAEDPSTFLPSPGVIETLRVPAGPGVRDDGGAYEGCTISSYYDPLVSKLSVWADTREHAVARMRRALSEYVITGIRTNLAFHDALFRHPEFVAGRYDTGFIERYRTELGPVPVEPQRRDALAVATAVAAMQIERAAYSKSAGAGSGGGTLSPWVAEHRSRVMRRDCRLRPEARANSVHSPR